MPRSDWSQFIPDLIVGLLLLLVASAGAIFSYIRSKRFREWLKPMLNRLGIGVKWLIGQWRLIALYGFAAVIGIMVFRAQPDWKAVAFSFLCYAVGLLSWRILKHRSLASTEIKTGFVPVPLFPGIGNSYFRNRYIAPPSGNVLLGCAQFQVKPDSLIFDTNEEIRYFLPRSDGGKEIALRLPTPQNQVKSVYFLINSGNSRSIYAHRAIGEIKLVFKDAPPIVVDLILGENIREWCPGNPGDYVREASSPMVAMGVWTGLSKSGNTAVIDCLRIPVYECMRNCYLEKILLIHKSSPQPPDTIGVHFLVFAISLEIEQRMQNRA